MLTDDHAGYVLGVERNRRARTPNVDELREGGNAILPELLQLVCIARRHQLFQRPTAAPNLGDTITHALSGK